ncbi:MAG: L-lactate permease [Chloroflexi bacterium]|nr:L-lactate permease [Chloroflexota bacterium]
MATENGRTGPRIPDPGRSLVVGPWPDSVLSLVAVLPIVTLLGGLGWLGWSAQRSAVTSFVLAAALGFGLFGLSPEGGLVAITKGMLLSLFVLLILWAALFLQILLDALGAVQTIGTAMVRAARWPAVRALLIGWGFSGFIQGFAGFGAPVASVVPLLQAAGFGGVRSAAAAMVGHSWAITFGSMGSSYFAIQLVTRIPGEVLAPWLGILFVPPIMITGIAVLHILLGWRGLYAGGTLAVAVGAVMAAALYLAAVLGAGAVASIIAAMVGCAILLTVAYGASRVVGVSAGATSETPRSNIHLAMLPYYLLVVLTLGAQAGPLAGLGRSLMLGIDLPSTTTGLSYQVAAEAAYPRLRLFQHPATIITMAILISAAAYRAAGRWPEGAFTRTARMTYRRSKTTSITVLFLVMMSLVMADSGMISSLALGLRALVGPAFPLLSPFLGVLGALMTGSNTNSNVAMGALQTETALALGLTPALIAAAQSVGGSLGAGVSPDKAVVGANAAGVPGQEAAILRLALPYSLLAAAAVGVEVWLLSRWLG